MYVLVLCVFLFVGRGVNGFRGNRNSIVPPNLLEALDIPRTRITTRFNFPGSNNECFTNAGEKGRCLPLNSCPELLDFIRNQNGLRTREGVRFLRNRICRFERNSVRLCCVNQDDTTIAPPDDVRTDKVPLPTNNECGFTTIRRITNGREYEHGAHPWLAALGFTQSNGTFRVLCGGTLITKRHVLTAAHCFIRRPGLRPITQIRLGEHSLLQNNERRPPLTLNVMDRVSPGYDRISHINDIELVTMDQDVPFTTYVRPACLPFGFESRNFENEPLTILGWGHTFFRAGVGTDRPLAANITIIPKDICREDYKTEPQVPLDNTQLCAGKGAEDACQGDSGGPLLYRGQQFYLLGVVSFGVGCANTNFPGVYTYVPEFLKWISDNV